MLSRDCQIFNGKIELTKQKCRNLKSIQHWEIILRSLPIYAYSFLSNKISTIHVAKTSWYTCRPYHTEQTAIWENWSSAKNTLLLNRKTKYWYRSCLSSWHTEFLPLQISFTSIVDSWHWTFTFVLIMMFIFFFLDGFCFTPYQGSCTLGGIKYWLTKLLDF